jgi:hypothetical protein
VAWDRSVVDVHGTIDYVEVDRETTWKIGKIKIETKKWRENSIPRSRECNGREAVMIPLAASKYHRDLWIGTCLIAMKSMR